MKDKINIVGKRIFLRILTPKDVTRKYVEWMHDDEVTRFTESRGKKYTLGELKDYVRQKKENLNDYLFGIFLKESNEHIGNIKIGSINQTEKEADIGIIIGNKTIWGEGYATEAIELATEYAFNGLGLDRLIAGMIKGNIGSYKAFIKAGYRNSAGPISDKEESADDGLWVERIKPE